MSGTVDTRMMGDSTQGDDCPDRDSEPAGKTLADIFNTFSTSATIGERVIRGLNAFRSPRHSGASQVDDDDDDMPAAAVDQGGKSPAAAVSSPAASPSSPRHAPIVPASQLQIDAAAVVTEVGHWGFDAFTFSQLACARQAPLVAAVMAALQTPAYGIFNTLDIPLAKLRSFLNDVENSYFSFAYHNHIHACDTVQAVHYLLSECGLHSLARLGPLDTLALVLSTAIHDVGHPGLNNGFHVATRDALAISYHDVSVLENYHAGIGMQLLSRPGNNFLVDVFARLQQSTAGTTTTTVATCVAGVGGNNSPTTSAAFRRTMVDLVLATDLARHKAILEEFQSLIAPTTATACGGPLRCGSGAAGAPPANLLVRVAEAPPLPQRPRLTKQMLLKMTIKSADISHPTRRFAVHRKFSEAIQLEFFEQGDIERERGMPISFLCDRTINASLPGSQIGFVKFMILPFFRCLTGFLADHGHTRAQELLVVNAEANLAIWERLKVLEDGARAAAATVASAAAASAIAGGCHTTASGLRNKHSGKGHSKCKRSSNNSSVTNSRSTHS